MYFSKNVGLALKVAAERDLMRTAIFSCDLCPIDLERAYQTAGAVPPALAEDSLSGVRLAPEKPRLIVTDDPAAAYAEVGCRNCWGRYAALVLLVTDAKDPQGPSRTAEGLSDGHPWVLPRPLNLELVKDQLLKAAHASLVFAERDRSIVEELCRSRRILDCMSNGVTVSDATLPDHPLIYVNPAFEHMTGYSASESCGRNSRFLQGPDTDPREIARIHDAIAQGNDVRAVLRNYRKDGAAFWNEFHLSPIFDPLGRLTHFAGFQSDVTERVESARQVEHLATHDPLTGLANRALMMDRLKMAVLRGQRNETAVALLFFDLNNFKYVNDVFGHQAGDVLLIEIARRLERETRGSETVARLGGDEFVVVLEDLASEREALEVEVRLANRLSQTYDLGDEAFHPSASIGMALFPRDAQTPEALLKAADARMYLAKERFHHATPRVEVGAADRL